jgi:hypothetical protein
MSNPVPSLDIAVAPLSAKTLENALTKAPATHNFKAWFFSCLTLFVLFLLALIGVGIYLVVRLSKLKKRATGAFDAVGHAAENTLFCDANPTECTISPAEASNITFPDPTETSFTVSTSKSLIKMMWNVYEGKEPFKLPVNGNNVQETWRPLYVEHNVDKPYGWVCVYKMVIYIIYRGTDAENDAEWEVDFKVALAEFMDTGITCHKGYVEEVAKFLEPIEDILVNYKSSTIFTTGHSMGGGYTLLTSLFALQLDPLRKVVCYAYGSPRICDCSGSSSGTYSDEFVNFHYYNITNVLDPVPNTPPSVTPDTVKDNNGNAVLHFYCEYGQLGQYQDNRLSLWQNHSLTTYYHNAANVKMCS